MAGGTGTTKRMSADEKRKAILAIYHTTKSVYTEKEILALATKAGVASNTVLDVNQSLVDDGLVDKEKIGGTNYWWSFPAKSDRKMQLEHVAALERVEVLQASLAEARHRLADARRGREEEEEANGGEVGADGSTTTITRASKLRKLEELRAERAKVERELESLRENDPQALADLEKELRLVTEAANRWTDNIFNCKSYLTKKRGMDRKEAEKILGINSAFDYPEDKNFK